MQTTAKRYGPVGGPMGGSLSVAAAASLFWLSLSMSALAQLAEVSVASTAAVAVIPQQVRYTGALANRSGETVEAVFSIYATAEGGEALWTETQRVSVSADGSYSVVLGAASEKGLPQAVFAAGQARWLGVTIDRAEGVRSPLSSVAYAMKAGDAESVGGIAAASLVTKEELAKLSQTGTTAVQGQPQIQPQPALTPTGSGTADYVALWTAAGNLGDSGIYQAASGYVGIGTTTPAGPLELATGAVGGTNATMMLEQTNAAAGNYYANIGLYNSTGLIGNISALGAGYNLSNLWGANDVVFLGGQKNAATNLIMMTNTSGALKFGTGGYKPANERLRIGKTGGVSIGNAYVGTDPGPGALIVSGNVGIGTTAPTANLEVNGTAKFDGMITFAAGQTFPVTGTGGGTITGITTSSPLTGSGTSGTVALGLNTATLETTLNGVYAQLGASDTFSNGITSTQAQGIAYTAVYGEGTSGSTGVYGSSDSGYGVSASSTSGVAVYAHSASDIAGSFSNGSPTNVTILATNIDPGSAATTPLVIQATSSGINATGVSSFMKGNGAIGLYGESDGGVEPNSGPGNNEYDQPTGVEGVATGVDGYGTVGDASGVGSVGVLGSATGGPDSYNSPSIGAIGQANAGIGVLGISIGSSNTYKLLSGDTFTGGVWGDTSSGGNLGGIVGTADDNNAAFLDNNSSGNSTISAYNAYNSGKGPTGLFQVFKAATPNGTCGIGDGNLSCTGQLKTLATTGGGARTVETYATQSAENWMEDYGTGAMERGVGVVQIDPAFAETVSGDASYHVFLTPRGDLKSPLYVTNVTAGSFEVREANGGTSSISFDYKIVAKRRGYEAQRFVDVTDRFNAEQAETKRRIPAMTTAAAPRRMMTPRRPTAGRSVVGAAMPRPNAKPGGAAMPAPVAPKTPGSAAKPVVKPIVEK